MDEYIRVFARIRATNDVKEKVVTSDNANNIITFCLNKDEKTFTFDRVFSESSTQESVFAQVGKRIIDGCLEGYNGTIFAYGQTGSGKTFTMFGPQNEDGSFKKNYQGLIPRCMDYLFDLLNMKHQKDQGFTFTVTCSFIQLYNEVLYDLLDNGGAKLRLRTNSTKRVYVENAIVESVQSRNEVLELLRIGYKNRKVAETGMNRESSRSHAIFIVELATQHSFDGLISHRNAYLNLVDLAGSERQSDSQTRGSHLKEAGYINKSLSILTRVIRNLSKNSKQYPGYRDSPLTRLLQDSLGGNARSTVIVNLHPNIEYADTTASSLYFSDTVKRIKNKATANENLAGENLEALKKEINRLKEENELLKISRVKHCELEHEVEELKKLLSEKEKELTEAEINQSIVLYKDNLRDALDESIQIHNKTHELVMNFEVEEDQKKMIKNFESEELNELIKKLSESEQKVLALERRLTKAEKLNENYRCVLTKREEAILQFEGDLAYKSRRVDNLREVLDEIQIKLASLEEENEFLKIENVKMNKLKAEAEKSSKEELDSVIKQLNKQVEELTLQRNNAQKDLSDLAGHTNSKQKINYVKKLRERISILENKTIFSIFKTMIYIIYTSST